MEVRLLFVLEKGLIISGKSLKAHEEGVSYAGMNLKSILYGIILKVL